MCNLIAFILLVISVVPAHAKDFYKIGEIKISLLRVSDFQQLYGEEWVLLDGASLQGTDLGSLGLYKGKDNKLPDGRGKFLRMYNNNLDDFKAKGNPENLALGAEQMDTFKEHKHQQNPRGVYYKGKGASVGSWNNGKTGKISDKGSHRDTGPEGSEETRPKNITVNFFIKVNNCGPKSSSKNCL